MSLPMIIILVLLVLAIVYIWSTYNGLATGKVRIQDAFSGIDVQLKRRTDLIPNLIETVKGYAKHETELLENVTKARTSLMQAKTPGDKAASNNALTDTLKNLFAVAENYPTLKANENFLALQEELSDTENKIAYSRQFYNTNVRDYNTTLTTFPSGMLGNMFGFQKQDFFEATAAEREAVKVKF